METEKLQESKEEQFIVQEVEPVALDSMQLRLQLLSLSKEILEHQSHLMWETHKEVVDVSIEDVVSGARTLLDFLDNG